LIRDFGAMVVQSYLAVFEVEIVARHALLHEGAGAR
jgi:hypothetical protein